MVKIGYFENGIVYAGKTDEGFCYKNEDAFVNYPNVICYVPEHGFPEDSGCKCPEEDAEGYTYNDLLKLCSGVESLCRSMFDCLEWICPETWLDEYCRDEYS